MSEPSSVNIEQVEGVTVVGFRDASILDVLTIQRIGTALFEVVEGGHKSVVLDLKHVRFLSSQALGVLLTLRKKADKAGCDVALAGIRPELARVFKITNLDALFKFYPDREAAVAAMAAEA